MILLDTDTLSLLVRGHERVWQRLGQRAEEIAITVITRIETLKGRFDALLKAADGLQLLLGMHHLEKATRDLDRIVTMPVTEAAAQEFDRLRQHKKLKKIGRGDLLIACIALANRATLVTRNLRHFQLVPGLRLENWAD